LRLHMAGANFRVQRKEGVGPELIPGFNALLGETVVSPLRSGRVVILNARRLSLAGQLNL